MTAAPSPQEIYLPEPRREGSFLTVAAIGAALLHALALFIPIPRQDIIVLIPPRPEGPVIISPTIEPPPLPEPTEQATLPTKLVPWPDAAPPDLRPPVEDQVSNTPLTHDGDPLVAFDDVEAPPRVEPAVYPEHTPGLVPPRPFAERARPEYPEMARITRREGRVLLRAVISAEGFVESITILEAPEPDLGFVDAALDAVRTWRYEPGTMGDRPVAVELTVVVEFTLR